MLHDYENKGNLENLLGTLESLHRNKKALGPTNIMIQTRIPVVHSENESSLIPQFGTC
jgi:hypothetical protein